MPETLQEQLRKKARITCDIAGGVCWDGEPKVPNERCPKCDLFLQWVKLDDVLKIVEEMTKDLVLIEQDLYKQAVKWGNKGEMEISAIFVRAGDAIREKRMKWFGGKKVKIHVTVNDGPIRIGRKIDE